MAEMTKPKAPVRRFDVFAEYNRQKAEAEGMAPDAARGYGLWLAKVVASRGLRGRPAKSQHSGAGAPSTDEAHQDPPLIEGKWRTLEGQPQTDSLFEKEIVSRLGEDFYRDVLIPAIRQALQEGKSYTAIRDVIRREWK